MPHIHNAHKVPSHVVCCVTLVCALLPPVMTYGACETELIEREMREEEGEERHGEMEHGTRTRERHKSDGGRGEKRARD